MDPKRAVNVIVAQPKSEIIASYLRRKLKHVNVEFFPTNQADEISDNVWKACEVLYTERALPSPEQAPNLNWIQFHYAGIDYAVNMPILQKVGLQATTLSGVPAIPMGEYVLMMMLALGHKLDVIRKFQDENNWPDNRFDRLSPLALRHSTVGIVGYGSSGRQVARLAKACGARVLSVKRDSNRRTDAGYIPKGTGDKKGRFVERIYPIQSLREMLPECDFIVVCVPLTTDTRQMIGIEEFNVMKPGSYLIDISRGTVVDHKQLLQALDQGLLAGAALDVFPEEPLQSDDPIWKHPKIWISPHISGYSPQYFQEAAHLFYTNMRLYLAEKPLYNLFQIVRGY